MSILIHILNEDTVAFYYPIPADIYEPASADQTRVPASTRLSAEDVQLLKDGRIFEVVTTYIAGKDTTGEIYAELESEYADEESTALEDYVEQSAHYVGTAYDGVDWS